MQLADNLLYVMRLRRAGSWRAKNAASRIRKGKMRLRDLEEMAHAAGCSLVFLVSGGRYDYHGELTTAEAIDASIRHKGLDRHEVARSLGLQNAYGMAQTIRDGTVTVRRLTEIAEKTGIPLHEMLCDGEQEKAPEEIPGRQASPRVINRDLYKMGWL